jgi:hypothetical protein
MFCSTANMAEQPHYVNHFYQDDLTYPMNAVQ